MKLTITFRNDNPKTIANRLAARIGREPTNAELVAEVRRILAAQDQRNVANYIAEGLGEI